MSADKKPYNPYAFPHQEEITLGEQHFINENLRAELMKRLEESKVTKSKTIQNTGMTMRDYFAGKALTGIVSKYNMKEPSDQDIVCQMAYELADVMLSIREKTI